MSAPRRRPDLNTPEWRKLRLLVLERDGWACTSCGKAVEGSDATVDHVIPYTGAESNALSNLVTLCRPCNSTKGARAVFRLTWINKRWLSHV